MGSRRRNLPTPTRGQAHPIACDVSPAPREQTTVAPRQATVPPLLQTTIDEDCETTSEEKTSDAVDESANETVSELRLRSTSFLSVGTAPSVSSLDTSLDEEGSASPNPRHSVRRDRSHTWSHGPLKFKAAKRSGSLPPMDGMTTQVPKLNLSEGRDSPFPATVTPSCVSPRKYGKLLVCSDHRMSTSPRLPPIGCVSDLQSPRSLPKNVPRELSREVSVIDPALIENSDPTEVRMVGRRRNALLTPQPASPGRDS